MAETGPSKIAMTCTFAVLVCFGYDRRDDREPLVSLTGAPWRRARRPARRLSDFDRIDCDRRECAPVVAAHRLGAATSNSFDRPFLFDLAGDAHDAAGWLHWSKGRELHIPQERRWNPGKGLTGESYEHANGAFLVDHRAIGGRYYLVYEDSPALDTFGGAGPAELGLARSRDLIHWTVPPGR